MLRLAKCWLRLISLSVSVVMLGSLAFYFLEAQTYTVCPSGCPFSKIQAALDAAKDGDTITVGPGRYRENLKITKSVSLIGTGPAQVWLIPGASAYALIQIGEDSTLEAIRIEGFALELGHAAGLVEESVYVDVGTLVRKLIFRNNRVFTPYGYTSTASLSGGEVTVERNIFSDNSRLEVTGRLIYLADNSLWLASVNPFLGRGEENYAEVEGNSFSKDGGLVVSGNTLVRKNRFRSASLVIGIGGTAEVEAVGVRENEFIGPGTRRSRSDIFDLSEAIIVGNSGDRVLIRRNRILYYDVGIAIKGWWQPSPEIMIWENVISEGIWGIWVKELARQPSRIEIIVNTIERQKFPKGVDALGGPSLGAALVVDREARDVEVVFKSNLVLLGEFGVALLAESGQIALEGNTIIENDLWGVFLAVPPCWEFDTPAKIQVTGSANEIANNGKRLKPEEKQRGDGEGNVCPKELLSLKK